MMVLIVIGAALALSGLISLARAIGDEQVLTMLNQEEQARRVSDQHATSKAIREINQAAYEAQRLRGNEQRRRE